MTQAETDILAEREKQRADPRYGDKHDDEHADGALHMAASYVASHLDDTATPEWAYAIVEKHCDNRRKQLVIAAALLIAEVERIDRASAPEQEDSNPERRRCNRHDDCDVAEAFADAHGRPRPDHCHDDECSDCFGD